MDGQRPEPSTIFSGFRARSAAARGSHASPVRSPENLTRGALPSAGATPASLLFAENRLSGCARSGAGKLHPVCRRSEEHTSELQSLMRISYAVFCLKTKKQT